MRSISATRVGGLALALLLVLPQAGAAEAMRLSADARNLRDYFPTYLANGYFSMTTTRRGTRAGTAYMATVMDRSPGDVARLAALPGWSGFDLDDGRQRLNDIPHPAAALAGYQQTLDLRDGVLTTRYRWIDGDRSTAVALTQFVSQASPHVGVARLAVTPSWNGTLRVEAGLHLWPAPPHRLALARLDLAQMRQAVHAAGERLEPQPPATPDRAALWYPGQVLTDHVDVDTAAHTLRYTGHSPGGPRVAMAMALRAAGPGLPADATTSARAQDAPGLVLRVPVLAGRTYVFEKFVSVSRSGWGDPAGAAQDLRRARAARAAGYAPALRQTRAAWARLWRAHITIDGDPALQRVLDADLFYLYENSVPGGTMPMMACGFSPNYNGHVFWDSDSWDFPALLLLHPRRAAALVDFRARTLAAARARARQLGWRGALYPWEADPGTGTDQTPHFAVRNALAEIHVGSDIAIAQWDYFQATGDRRWLRRRGWPVIRAVADFWLSRVHYDARNGRYEILHVVSPDEDYDDVDNDAFTNATAQKALRIATAAARELGIRPDRRWREVADRLYFPFSRPGEHYLDFDPTAAHKETWVGSTLPMLNYPPLDFPMPATVRRNDFTAALRGVQRAIVRANSMFMTMISISADTLGMPDTALLWLQRSTWPYLRAPFDVRTETPTNNTGYLLSASSGFIQNFVYGFTGLRITGHGVRGVYPAVLPAGWRALTLHHIAIGGRRYDLRLARDAQGRVLRTLTPAAERAAAPATAGTTISPASNTP